MATTVYFLTNTNSQQKVLTHWPRWTNQITELHIHSNVLEPNTEHNINNYKHINWSLFAFKSGIEANVWFLVPGAKTI